MKKLLSILLTLALAVIAAAGMTVFAAAETETQTTGIIYGDANADGTVNMKDVLTIRKYVAGIAVEIDLIAADTNGDGAVNMKDVLTVRKFVAGLIPVIEGGKTEPTATEPTAAPTEPARETVVFGSYEQDGNLDNGAEPIEWIVLEEKDGAKLLLSRYVLDYRMQADHYCENYQWGIGEDVRSWLNNDFYDEAFSEDEQALLRDRCIVNKSTKPNSKDVPTYNWVSLLSAEELGQYFDLKTDTQNNTYSESVLAEATPYAAANFEFTTTVDANWYGFKHLGYSDEWMGKNTALWLLRAPGGGGSCDASFVSDSGIVCYDYLTTFLGGVRPVILLADEPYTFDETVCYPKNVKKMKMAWHNDNGVARDWIEYTYDANGNVTSKRTYWNGIIDDLGGWHEYTYDANGNITSERRYDVYGSVAYRSEYTYDANGNQTSERQYNEDGSVYWEYSWDATYDTNGNQTSERHYNANGSVAWNSYDTWDATYDANGNQTSYRRYGEDGSVAYESSSEYVYDANGNLLTVTYYNADGSVDYWHEYTYDESGNCIRSRVMDEDGNIIWDSYETWDVIYDGNKKETISYWDSQGNVESREVEILDDQGRQLSWQYIEYDFPEDYSGDTNRGGMSHHYHEYTYYEDGKLKSEKNYYDSFGEELSSWTEYIYDGELLVKEVCYDDWLGNYETNYLYDKNGNLLCEKSINTESGHIQKTIKAWALGWKTYEYE